MNSPRILIVEDEALEAFLLSDCLRLEGFQVCGLASQGDDALRIMQTEQPDVIIMDIGLSGAMDGIATARQIRTFSNVPILFLTGYLTEATTAQIQALHPAMQLTKPARIQEVLFKIQRLLV